MSPDERSALKPKTTTATTPPTIKRTARAGTPGVARTRGRPRFAQVLAAPELGGPLEFLRLLWAVAHGLESLSKRMSASLGLTGPQRLVVRMVGRFPSITSTQLAQLLHVDPSTLTGVLQRLERRGLLTRTRDGHDRRRALIGLTADGRRFDVETEGTTEAAVAATLAKVSAGDAASARRALSVLVAMLDAATGAKLDTKPRTKPRTKPPTKPRTKPRTK